MGYHADSSPALVRRQQMGQDVSALLGSKFFFSTGKDDPYCSKFIYLVYKNTQILLFKIFLRFKIPKLDG